MNAYTIQQGFETKVDGTDGEYWMIIAPDGQAVATETHKGKAELAARVWNNQFAEKTERIAELEAKLDALKTLAEQVIEKTQRYDDSYYLGERQICRSILAILEAPHAAPVPAAVTLDNKQLDYLARAVAKNRPNVFSQDVMYSLPDWLKKVVVRVSVSTNGMEYFKLTDDYDTPANRAAIAAKRAELGLS